MRSINLILALAATVCLAGGCATKTAPKALKVRLAVLDFLPPDAIYSQQDFTIKEREGWWMGTEDVYRSQHIGMQLSDALASRLGRAESITAHSREDLRQYLADKEDLLREAYPDLEDPQIAQLLLRTQMENAVEIGRELAVDRVITGEVLVGQMSHNRAFHSWKGVVEVRLNVWDVTVNERIVEDRTFRKRKLFGSTQLAMEALADDVAEMLATEYGHR